LFASAAGALGGTAGAVRGGAALPIRDDDGGTGVISSVAMEATLLPGNRFRTGLRSVVGARPSTAVDCLRSWPTGRFSLSGGDKVGGRLLVALDFFCAGDTGRTISLLNLAAADFFCLLGEAESMFGDPVEPRLETLRFGESSSREGECDRERLLSLLVVG